MKIIVYKDGNTRAITGEAGKYWITGEERVRKLSGSILEIREVPDPVEIRVAPEAAPAELHGSASAAKPRKKNTGKKKTEDTGDGERGE